MMTSDKELAEKVLEEYIKRTYLSDRYSEVFVNRQISHVLKDGNWVSQKWMINLAISLARAHQKEVDELQSMGLIQVTAETIRADERKRILEGITKIEWEEQVNL